MNTKARSPRSIYSSNHIILAFCRMCYQIFSFVVDGGGGTGLLNTLKWAWPGTGEGILGDITITILAACN